MSAMPVPRYYRMTLTEFIRLNFIGKPPSRNTIKATIEDGIWSGEKVLGTYYIFVDAEGQPIRKTKDVSTGNLEADALLKDWDRSRE